MLRAALGATAIVQGAGYLASRAGLTAVAWAAGLLAVASGASLVLGFLTPVAAAMIAAGESAVALGWISAPAPNLLDAGPAASFVVVVAVAIVFLGPGAFSADSRLFGRREIIIPPASRSEKV